MLFQHFGGKLNAELIAKYSRSPNWQNGCFQNLEPTNVGVSLAKMPAMLYKQIASRPNKTPKTALPIAPFDREAFLAPSDTAKFIWYGHSVLLLRMRGKTLLIDPMFGPDAAPIAPVAARRFSEGTLDIIDALPDIDLLLLTHDHYDHLDYASIQRLKSKTRQYFVALGVKRHLCAWGIPSERITEFDWWDHRVFEGIEVYFTPSRHFSGRGWSDRFKSLWGGWVLQSGQESLYFSGDSGYGKHFQAIGERLGPFDLAFMECGQYNNDWPTIHLFPQESVQAALDVNARKAMPVHWAAFSMSYQHTWFDPPEHFVQAAAARHLPVLTPPPGRIFGAAQADGERWWRAFV